MSRYKTIPLTLKQANEFIETHHRHHKKVVGHRFSIGAIDNNDNTMCAVAIVGRPVARKCDPYLTAEVTRLCSMDGRKNVCSFLYSACARICKEMGFSRIQTYILNCEDGITLKAAGWSMEAASSGGQWKHTDGKPRRTDQPTDPKIRYGRSL